MSASSSTTSLIRSGLAASLLLLASGAGLAQTVSLTAGTATTILPDGQSVPMWGYTCGAATGATCAASKTTSVASGPWSPVVITVPYTESSPGVSTTSLTISLTNNLSFANGNTVPTSLVIVGQLGGGLGGAPTTTPSPVHPPQGVTWPASGPPDPTLCAGASGTNCPPSQPARVQSFATEVAAGLTPSALFWDKLKPGTYLIHSGTHPSIQSPMGLYGVLVVTAAGSAYPAIAPAAAVTYGADVPLLLSEIDPVQNRAVDQAVNTLGFSETAVWNGQTVGGVPGCGDPSVHTCYPPAVNYDPRYFMINGVSFDKSNASKSLFATTPAASASTVLVRFVNAGLRMHVPSIVGAKTGSTTGFALIAEDGNRLPGLPKVQNQVFLAAGKTYDVLMGSPTGTQALAVFDRQGSLSTNNQRDGGMQAYISVNGGGLPNFIATNTTTGASNSAAVANPDNYYVVGSNTLTVSDPAKGLIANDVGVYGVAVSGAAPAGLTLYSNGTFEYTGPPVVFSYCGNGATTGSACSTVTLAACTGACLGAAPVASNIQFKSNVATRYASPPPGVLAGVQNASGLALTAVAGAATGGTVDLKDDGTFLVTGAGVSCPAGLSPPAPLTASCISFPYSAKNSQGTSSNTATATVVFLAPSGLNLAVKDARNGLAISDYRWIIEEDKTFWVDPNCQVNTTSARFDSYGRPCPALPVESLGYNFHTAAMPVIATGCVGSVSCESGQTVLDPNKPFNPTDPLGTHVYAACDVGNGVCRAAATKVETLPSQVALDPNKHYYISVLPGDGVNPVVGGAGGPAGGTANLTKSGSIITLQSPDGFFGVVVGDKITIAGTFGPANGDCIVQSKGTTSLGVPFVTCKPVTLVSGNGSAAGVLFSGTRQFDVIKDCGDYNPAAGGVWEPSGLAAKCGHAMGGAQIAPGQTSASISLQQTPLPTSKIAVFVFQDDNPLNGENDAGGGADVIAPNEPGLGGFELKLFDQAGGLGDATGQLTYDMFNMPVSNSLAGTKDPVTGQDACPITQRTDGMVGMIPTCPKFMADGVTPSPLAGQAVIANLYPGLYEVVATPAADRIGRGEEWLQTNTLDGGKAHEAFIKPNEPGYFQEFGPGGFHVAIGFANPKFINDRKTNALGTGMCDPLPGGGGLTCGATLNGRVTSARMSRTPDQRLYSSGNYDAYSFTQCYVSLSAPDSADFAFAKCNPDGTFTFGNIPTGDFKLTVFDQWNDLMLDGLVSPVHVANGSTTSIDFPVTQWRANIYTRTYLDMNGDGISTHDLTGTACTAPNVPAGCNPNFGADTEPGLTLVSTNIRYRDGSFGFFNNTDLNGYAGFNEVFPFMNWLVVETDATRYKPTGAHVVYDAGGPADGTTGGGNSTIAAGLANTIERVPLPSNLRVPGARYCANADCLPGDTTGGSTGRVDPAWAVTQGWQGLLGQNSFIEFGMKPFAPASGTLPAENGGIRGHVIYASTRPFDDPTLSLQLSWEPGVPRVTINLYQQGTAPDGTTSLKLVDTSKTSSWDDWAQGFRSDGVPNMNCPGQDATSPFFQTLQDSKQWLDDTKTALPNHSQFKCYDGWSQLNQIQPAPYDGMYKFPSVTGISPTTGLPAGTNCSICVPNPTGDGTMMLPAGKYVVEVIVPPGFELVKEEDKNILLGDVYIAPISQQFAGLGSVFIMPDQAAVNAYYNKNNPLNQTTNFGLPRHEGDTGSVESFWPCVGAKRIVPDFNSLFPTSGQNSPFAGASRNLCDRKAVILEDQATALAKFYIFTPTHIAGHFAGTITNDFASEFDPFSPQFGEKFGPPNLPVGMRDFTGSEVARVYSDQWGIYNGLYFSTYGVNPPNPTGYVPQMAIACMNDPGPIVDTRKVLTDGSTNPTFGQSITDPHYNPAYSNFCYETPFMPGFTAYMDTPVIPTQAFADGYNLPDSEYPNNTPAIKSVLGDAIGTSGGRGPWVSAAGHTLTIAALGDKVVQNPAWSGPNSTIAPYNQKTITRHYGFGSTQGTVTIGGVPATVGSGGWSDLQIVVTVPTLPLCAVQRGAGVGVRCGELVITTADGKQSIDAVTVTVSSTTPKYVSPASPSSTAFGQTFPNPLQKALDDAVPGDLIIVGPGTYRENLVMWKPVRLQGVGAGSVTINADAHPVGKLDPWRRQIACLFGLKIDGTINLNNAAYDSTGTYVCPASMALRSDRIPFEGFVGWDASSNGNLAQLLQEPSLMGAYEGAGITVVGRGVRIPLASTDFWGQGIGESTFPDGSVYLTTSTSDCTASTTRQDGRDYGTANYLCNPSRIDGLTVMNSSQGGGGVFIHGWNHGIEVANNRVQANHGTLSGGINVGNGETPPGFFNDGITCGAGLTSFCPPLPPGIVANAQIPFQLNVNVHVHHNAVINNASLGDALFSGTPSGAGGVTFSSGADNFVFDHNWISGNLATGDGAGVLQLGHSAGGRIANNWVLFNQSVNPTLPTNGGGIAVVGATSDRMLPNGTECGTTTDVDCPPGISEGTGPGLVIDANLIAGNSAEGGSGGGLRLQQVNGMEVGNFTTAPSNWYGITVTNNIIVNNVAGWDGAGVSMQDAMKVTFVNNTVASNDTTASAGVLFKTLGAITSSAPPPGCTPTPDPTQPQNPACLDPNAPHNPNPAGFSTQEHTPNLRDLLTGAVTCPTSSTDGSYPYSAASNGNCKFVSLPILKNDMFWRNRAFHVEITDTVGSSTNSGLTSQQNLITLMPQLNQASTGACATAAASLYWDIGVRGDTGLAGGNQLVQTGPTTFVDARLTPVNSILSDSTAVGDYPANANRAPGSSPVIAQYCNGSRVPPENGGHGYNAPAGRSETTGLSPVFVFNNITPAATVDEGHNWINLTYGPLTLSKPTVTTTTAAELMVANAAAGSAGGAYSLPSTSSDAINRGTNTGLPASTATDFFGNPRARTTANPADIGAVEFQAPFVPVVSASFLPTSWTTSGTRGSVNSPTCSTTTPATTPCQTFTLMNTGNVTLTGITQGALTGLDASEFRIVGTASTCGPVSTSQPVGVTTLAPGSTCVVRVQFRPLLAQTTGTKTATVSVTDSAGTQSSALTGTAN